MIKILRMRSMHKTHYCVYKNIVLDAPEVNNERRRFPANKSEKTPSTHRRALTTLLTAKGSCFSVFCLANRYFIPLYFFFLFSYLLALSRQSPLAPPLTLRGIALQSTPQVSTVHSSHTTAIIYPPLVPDRVFTAKENDGNYIYLSNVWLARARTETTTARYINNRWAPLNRPVHACSRRRVPTATTDHCRRNSHCPVRANGLTDGVTHVPACHCCPTRLPLKSTTT